MIKYISVILIFGMPLLEILGRITISFKGLMFQKVLEYSSGKKNIYLFYLTEFPDISKYKFPQTYLFITVYLFLKE